MQNATPQFISLDGPFQVPFHGDSLFYKKRHLPFPSFGQSYDKDSACQKISITSCQSCQEGGERVSKVWPEQDTDGEQGPDQPKQGHTGKCNPIHKVLIILGHHWNCKTNKKVAWSSDIVKILNLLYHAFVYSLLILLSSIFPFMQWHSIYRD